MQIILTSMGDTEEQRNERKEDLEREKRRMDKQASIWEFGLEN